MAYLSLCYSGRVSYVEIDILDARRLSHWCVRVVGYFRSYNWLELIVLGSGFISRVGRYDGTCISQVSIAGL